MLAQHYMEAWCVCVCVFFARLFILKVHAFNHYGIQPKLQEIFIFIKYSRKILKISGLKAQHEMQN